MDKHTRARIESIREVYQGGLPWIRIVKWASDGAVTGLDYRTRAEARKDARLLHAFPADVTATYVVRA